MIFLLLTTVFHVISYDIMYFICRKTDFLCRVKYSNALPDIPFDTKFLACPFVSLSRLVWTCNLAHEFSMVDYFRSLIWIIFSYNFAFSIFCTFFLLFIDDAFCFIILLFLLHLLIYQKMEVIFSYTW